VNLANLLARAARLAPDAPAVALGERIVADYRGLAGRGARRRALRPARHRARRPHRAVHDQLARPMSS